MKNALFTQAEKKQQKKDRKKGAKKGKCGLKAAAALLVAAMLLGGCGSAEEISDVASAVETAAETDASADEEAVGGTEDSDETSEETAEEDSEEAEEDADAEDAEETSDASKDVSKDTSKDASKEDSKVDSKEETDKNVKNKTAEDASASSEGTEKDSEEGNAAEDMATDDATTADQAEETVETTAEQAAEATPEPVQTTSTVDTSFASNPKATIVDGSSIKFTATLPSIPASDDNMLYVYQLQVYQYEIPAGAQPIGSVAVSQNPEITFALNKGQSDTRLYSKFQLAIKSGGVVTPISTAQFVSNPEVLATKTHARSDGNGMIVSQQGTDYDFCNVPLGDKIYIDAPFVTRIAQVYSDGLANVYRNPYASAAESHPVDEKIGYMLNASNAEGVSALIKKMEYYASGATKTDDWIIGNEVNERKCCYMAWTSWDEYMRQYEQVFRICYIAIKSTNANANVYICLDQNWDRDSKDEYYIYMDGKDFMTQFASDVKANGDMSWGVSFHPYTVPLTWAKFWDVSGEANGSLYKSLVDSDKMVSFQNLSVVTNFMQTSAMLAPNGSMRPFIISELGISADQGADVQAAALCASYMAALRNGHVRSLIYVNSNAGGVNATFTSEALDMYNNLSDPSHQQKAMNIIGITDWSQVLR